MIISDEVLIPLLAHRDKVVRERIVYRFIGGKSYARSFNQKEVIEHCLAAITSFGIENNGFMLDLLAKFVLSRSQLRIFCEEVEKKNFLPKTSKRLFIRNGVENNVENGVEKVLLRQEPEALFSMPYELSNDFFEKYYVQKKKETFPADLKKSVKYSSAEEIWEFLKNKFIVSGGNEGLDSSYSKLMIELMNGKFSNEQRKEVKQFFATISAGGKLNLSAAFFYLRCIEVLKLKDLADEAFVLLEVSSSKQLYLQTVEVLALFKNRSYAEKIAGLYKLKNSMPALKSALIAFFSLNSCEYEEEFLMKIATIEKNRHRQLEIAIALSSIFSSQFIPYALSLLKKNGDYNFFDLEEEILVFSLLSDRKTTENEVFREFASNYFKRRSTRSFQPRLPFFIRKNLKQLWQDPKQP